MTCDAVQERLLEESTADFSALEDHLSHCPRCQQLADRIVDTQFELRQHVENFVSTTTLDRSWEHAIGEAQQSSWRPRIGLHAVGVAALTAAVLLVSFGGLGPEGGEPQEPGDPTALSAGVVPLALQEAEDKLAAFQDIDNTDLSLDGLSRQDEDRVQRDALAAKTQAMEDTLESFQALVDGPESDLRAEGLEGIAQTHEEMADSLANMPLPTYLTEAQAAVYRGALVAKAKRQWELAIETYRLAAKAQNDRSLAQSLRERAWELEAQMSDLDLDAAPGENPAIGERLVQFKVPTRDLHIAAGEEVLVFLWTDDEELMGPVLPPREAIDAVGGLTLPVTVPESEMITQMAADGLLRAVQVVDANQVLLAVNASSTSQGPVEVLVHTGGAKQSVGVAWVAQTGPQTLLRVPTARVSEFLVADMLGIDEFLDRESDDR